MGRHTTFIYTISDYKGNVIAEGSAREVAESMGYHQNYIPHCYNNKGGYIGEGKYKISRKEIQRVHGFGKY